MLKPIDINLLLASLENQFAPQAAKQGLKLKIRRRTHPPYSVYSDACMLKQIVGNLIDNAIKYTASGWILITTVKIDEHSFKLHIYDTGIGIAEQQQQNIYTEFYRGQRRRNDRQAQGMGVGLAYVLKAVEHLPGHSLDFYSKANRGSNFRLRLPVAIEQPCGKSLSAIGDSVSGSFVFIVDDDPEVLDALSEQLTGWGCLVQQARSKTETLGALADILRPPDLLISEFYLGGNETAHDIIAAIQTDCGPVPTLILSAHGIPDQDKTKWPESTVLLRKPASATVLLEMMTTAMGSAFTPSPIGRGLG